MIRVSAIVSLYNSLEFVGPCLEDLVQQTLFKRGELEIVVIDSNSPQDERSVVELYQRRYPNIQYHRTAERETLYQAWNRGIELANGDILTNANSDDRHHPEALEILSRLLLTRPEIDLVYADVYESTVSNQTFRDNPRSCRYSYPNYYAPLSLLYYQFGCQPVWRKRIHQVIGGFDSRLRAAGDWDFCVRFSLAGLRALRVPQVLGSFLNRPTSISSADNTSSREQGGIKNQYLNRENILALYRHEGFSADTAAERTRVLTDFAVRASNMALPWTPGKIFVEPNAALIGSRAAFEISQDDPRLAWNLGVSLLRVSQHTEALPLLRKGVELPHPEVSRALLALERGESVALPLIKV